MTVKTETYWDDFQGEEITETAVVGDAKEALRLYRRLLKRRDVMPLYCEMPVAVDGRQYAVRLWRQGPLWDDLWLGWARVENV